MGIQSKQIQKKAVKRAEELLAKLKAFESEAPGAPEIGELTATCSRLQEMLLTVKALSEFDLEEDLRSKPAPPKPADEHQAPAPESDEGEEKPRRDDPEAVQSADESKPRKEEPPIAESGTLEKNEEELEEDIKSASADNERQDTTDTSADKEKDNSAQKGESVPADDKPRKTDREKIRLFAEETSLSDKLEQQPIEDLKEAIGLNERFLFSNELFNGNMEAFNRALNELNHLETGEDAERYINEQLSVQFKWDSESETVERFAILVRRRFLTVNG